MEDNLKIDSEMLEPYIVMHCMNNTSFFLRVKQYLYAKGSSKKSHFNDIKLQFIFDLICKWYDKYNKFPTKKEFFILNEKVNKNNEDYKDLVNQTIKNLFDLDMSEVNSEEIEKSTEDFVKENLVYEAMLLSQQDLEKKNFGAISERMRKAVSVNFDKDLGVFIKDTKETSKLINELSDENTISTGIKSLDNALDGGWRSKEIYITSAPPGVGKTLLLGNFGINAFINGYNVLIFTFETSDKRLLSRYYTNLFNATKKEILSSEDYILNKQDELSKFTGDINIKEYPSNFANENVLSAHINDLWMYKNWKPDLIIIDYLLIGATNDKSMKSDNSFKYYKTVTEEYRNLGKIQNVPVLSACQINREGQDDKGGTKALNTSKNISESRGILDTADVFITLNQTARDREMNKMMMYIDKSRNDQKGQKIKVNVDYEHMRVFED